jgi:hypothetical protein
MTIHATLEARAQSLVSLVRGILRSRCYRAECWLQVLTWWLLHILVIHLLWGSLHLSIQPLHLKLWSWHLEPLELHLHGHLQSVHLSGSEELVRLREARPNIASLRLSREWWLPVAVVLHFLDLIFNHNGLVDHVLKIDVVGVEQLELNVIIQLIQKHFLLLLNRINVVCGVSRQLDE